MPLVSLLVLLSIAACYRMRLSGIPIEAPPDGAPLETLSRGHWRYVEMDG